MALNTYKGDLGEFSYDTDLWELKTLDSPSREYLHWRGASNLCSLPKGCVDTSLMFSNCKLDEDFCFEDFDTSEVVRMEGMFLRAELPKNFSLSAMNTKNVRRMNLMFAGVRFTEGFSFGDTFNTSNVTDMDRMFYRAVFCNSFNLGQNFNTRKVKFANEMFEGAFFNLDFNFPEDFYLQSYCGKCKMFAYCTLPLGMEFPLGIIRGEEPELEKDMFRNLRFVIPEKCESNPLVLFNELRDLYLKLGK